MECHVSSCSACRRPIAPVRSRHRPPFVPRHRRDPVSRAFRMRAGSALAPARFAHLIAPAREANAGHSSPSCFYGFFFSRRREKRRQTGPMDAGSLLRVHPITDFRMSSLDGGKIPEKSDGHLPARPPGPRIGADAPSGVTGRGCAPSTATGGGPPPQLSSRLLHCHPGPSIVVPDLIRDPETPAPPARTPPAWTPDLRFAPSGVTKGGGTLAGITRRGPLRALHPDPDLA